MMTKIIIPYKPREWAKQVHNTDKRWIIIVAHRRSGKTTLALNHLQRDALRVPNSRWGYIAPTYKQAKQIAWDLIKKYARPIPGTVFNESELTIKYPNGSKLTLYGSDYPDSLRGMGFWGVVFDEYSQQSPNVFSEIIRPALSDHHGYAIFLGTPKPKGKNELYYLYEKAKNDPEWLALHLTVDDTHLISDKELEEAKKVMTADEFQQEFYCSFESSVKGAYYANELAEAYKEKRITNVPYDKSKKVYTAWDLGNGDRLAIGFYQKVRKEVRMIDYWEGSNKDTLPDAVKMLMNKEYIYGGHFAPHDIHVKDFSTNKTRLETAKNLGINFQVVPKLGVQDGINAGKLMFKRLWIDKDKCRLFLNSISSYHQEWDEKRGVFKGTPYHDWSSHAADQYRYAAIMENKMGEEYLLKEKQLVNERRRNPVSYE